MALRLSFPQGQCQRGGGRHHALDQSADEVPGTSAPPSRDGERGRDLAPHEDGRSEPQPPGPVLPSSMAQPRVRICALARLRSRAAVMVASVKRGKGLARTLSRQGCLKASSNFASGRGVRGQQLAQHRPRRLSRTRAVAMHHAGHLPVAGDDQMGDGASCSVELGHVRRRDAWQLGVRDDLAAERGETQRGAVAAPTVERLLHVAIGSEPPEQPPRGAGVDLQGRRDLRTRKGVERQQLECLQRATGAVRVCRSWPGSRRILRRALQVAASGHNERAVR